MALFFLSMLLMHIFGEHYMLILVYLFVYFPSSILFRYLVTSFSRVHPLIHTHTNVQTSLGYHVYTHTPQTRCRYLADYPSE